MSIPRTASGCSRDPYEADTPAEPKAGSVPQRRLHVVGKGEAMECVAAGAGQAGSVWSSPGVVEEATAAPCWSLCRAFSFPQALLVLPFLFLLAVQFRRQDARGRAGTDLSATAPLPLTCVSCMWYGNLEKCGKMHGK